MQKNRKGRPSEAAFLFNPALCYNSSRMSTQKIGRYEIERKLGEGGMAVVYLARDPLTKRQVAVKMLLLPSQQFEIGRQLRARFEREAEIVAALEHPHIVPIHDFGEHDPDPSGGAGGQPFIVMRYMTGGSLAERIKQRGRLSLAETAGIIRKLASALDDAHRRGIVHRDIKPANILFDGRGEPYVSDFGIAKLGEAAGHLTGTGAVIGTPAYMSPEQVRGEKELDGRSDVYSLGVVIFEMLTGQTPYNADTPGKLMLKHVLEPVPRISTADPTLPAGCDAILLRALAKSHDDRYATAGDLADDLTQLAAAAVATAPTMIDTPLPTPAARTGGSETRPDMKMPAPLTEIDRPPVTPLPVAPQRLPPTHTSTPPVEALPPVETFAKHATSLQGRRVRVIAAIAIGAILLTLGGAFAISQFFNPVNRATATNAVAIIATTPAFTATRAHTPTPTHTATLPPLPTSTPEPSHTPTPQPGSEKDGMVQVFVPAGAFEMGSDSGYSDERPVHTVTLDAFWIDRTEVTNAMYALCVNAGACQPPSGSISSTRSSYYGNSQFGNYPVIFVSWNDAKAYCEWAGRRLPTEAEWEKAARGTDGRIYPWGNASPDSTLLNFYGNVGDTAEVGSYPSGASPYGALDMAGNVSEWVAGWYGAGYYNSRSDNPAGPSSGDYRVLRGGSWFVEPYFARAAFRGRFGPDDPMFHGFRCSRSP